MFVMVTVKIFRAHASLQGPQKVFGHLKCIESSMWFEYQRMIWILRSRIYLQMPLWYVFRSNAMKWMHSLSILRTSV